MKRRAKTKRAAEDLECDRLCSSPDGLLHHILSFLDMKHVVLTGILSKRWRNISSSVPNLLFPQPGYIDVDRFVGFVDRALLVNSAPKVQKFQLWFPCTEKYASLVDVWIRFAMIKGVQELDLGFPLEKGLLGHYSYKLPSSLLSCETLVSLKLHRCSFGASNFVNFTKLTALSLSFIVMRDGLIEDLLKGCPLLEDLDIWCFFCHPIKIRSFSSSSTSLQLRRLTIEGVQNGMVDIEAPNLQFLKIYIGNFVKFCSKDMPLLREANLDFSFVRNSTERCISSLELSLPSLRCAGVLNLCSTCLQVLPIPTFKDLQSYFFKTNRLTLGTGVQKCEMPGIANLLWSSPELENLVIDLVPSTSIYDKVSIMVKYDFDEREYWESLTVTFPCLLHHLKTIKITGFMGEGSLDSTAIATSFHEKVEQMKLVKFLLRNAMVLEKMTIHVSSRPKSVEEIEWERSMFRVAQKLIAFPRASSLVRSYFETNRTLGEFSLCVYVFLFWLNL